MKKFWRWENKAAVDEISGAPALKRTLFLDGVIAAESWFEDDVTPKAFKDELNLVSGDITVWINSPGGDCIAAAQIYNMLTEYKGKVTIFIDGLAASAASVIAMAGDEVVMSPVSLMMIHNPSCMAWGESKDLRKEAEILDEFKESIINAYEIKTGLSRVKISHLMDCETWFNANKAIELGFADKINIDNAENYADSAEVFSASAVMEAFSAVAVTRRAVANALIRKIKQKESTPAEFMVQNILNALNSMDTEISARSSENSTIDLANQTVEQHFVIDILKHLDCIKKHI